MQSQTDDIAKLKEKAEQGNADAQYDLGLIYAYGRGVPQDDNETAKWLRKAGEQGNVSAQNDLGVAYAHGTGVPRDEMEAVKWFRKAAEQGYANAQFNLNLLLRWTFIGWAVALVWALRKS